MMLYHFDNSMTTKTHWTEIYVIITVTTMLCEGIREVKKIDHSSSELRNVYLFLKTCHEYNTQMLELSVLPRSTLQAWIGKTFTSLPYLLFYLALSLRFCSRDDDHILTTARSIYISTFDVWKLFIAESFWHSIWKSGFFNHLNSLLLLSSSDRNYWCLRTWLVLSFSNALSEFVMYFQLRDLLAFVYMIFVAIAAYGVVSRSLIFYKQVPFTPHGIFKHIF